MALRRLPSQYAPQTIARPVTPTCCCCCCCLGTVAAGSIALPLLLHRVTTPPASRQSTAEHEPAATESVAGSTARPWGFFLSAAAIPAMGIVAWVTLSVLDGLEVLVTTPATVIGLAIPVVIGYLLAVAGYRIAGARRRPAFLIPLLVLVIAAALIVLEFFVWGAGIITPEGWDLPLALLFVVAVPALTVVFLRPR